MAISFLVSRDDACQAVLDERRCLATPTLIDGVVIELVTPTHATGDTVLVTAEARPFDI
jgi:hypothetical protein